jgi:hypothetical protein
MATFKKFDGIIGTQFFLDSTGADALKFVATNDGGGNPVLAVQDPAGSLIQIQASNVSLGTVQYLAFDIVFGDLGGTVDSTTTLPQNAVVQDLRVIVSTLFDGTSPTLEVGTVDTAALFGGTGDFNLAQSNTYTIPQWTEQPNATPRAIRATLAGGVGATQGAAKIVVGYVLVPNN